MTLRTSRPGSLYRLVSGRCRRWPDGAKRSLGELDQLAAGARDQRVVQSRELGAFCPGTFYLGRRRVGGWLSHFMLGRRQRAANVEKGRGLAFADHSFYRAVSTGERLPVEVDQRMGKGDRYVEVYPHRWASPTERWPTSAGGAHRIGDGNSCRSPKGIQAGYKRRGSYLILGETARAPVMAPVLCRSPPWENGPRSGRSRFV